MTVGLGACGEAPEDDATMNAAEGAPTAAPGGLGPAPSETGTASPTALAAPQVPAMTNDGMGAATEPAPTPPQPAAAEGAQMVPQVAMGSADESETSGTPVFPATPQPEDLPASGQLPTEAEGEAEPGMVPVPEPVVNPAPESEPESAPEAEPELEAEPEAEMETESEPETEMEPEPASEPEPAPEPPPGPAIGPRVCGCETPAGEAPGLVSQTIVVNSGEVFDGECLIYRADPGALGDGSQDEGQSPVFRVEHGGTLRNVVLGASAADGVHLYGDVQLENIHWLDIGEDAMTVKDEGTVHLDCGSAVDGEDKVFQVNAAAEIHISNFTARNAGKFMRQNGGTDFRVDVFIDHCDISDMGEVIFRTDSGSSFVTLTNTRYSDLGDGLFMFGDSVVNGNSGQSAVDNNAEY